MAPHPRAIAPPFAKFFTFAAFVLLTTVLPPRPSRFFFLAVDALSSLERLCAFFLGRHRSGFFLSLDVPQGPAILPEAVSYTHLRAHET